MHKKILLFLIMVYSLQIASVQATDWYVDNSVSISGSGQSWATAWKTFDNIVWGPDGVKAGDTLYISGGSSSKTYSGGFTIGASGTSDSARITIRVGQDPGHNGMVIIDGGGTALVLISANGRSYITIDGEYSGNRRIKLQSISYGGTGNNPTFISFNGGGNGNIIRYVELANGANGISLTYNSHFDVDNVWIHGISQDAAIQAAACSGTDFGDNKVRNSIIDLNWEEGGGYGPDGIVPTFYCDIYNNIFKHTSGVITVTQGGGYQHQDYVQANKYIRFYNNTVLGVSNAVMMITNWGASEWGEYYIYNNVFIGGGSTVLSGNMQSGLTSMKNFKVYGNTFVDWYYNVISFGFTTTGITMSGVEIKDNIFYNCGKSAIPQLVVMAKSNNIADCSDMIISNNVAYNANDAIGKKFYCNWGEVTNVNGLTGQPSFVNYVKDSLNSDLHLVSSDTVARDKGIPVTLPTGNTDRDGNIRGADGIWDIGAYEYGGAPPQCTSHSSFSCYSGDVYWYDSCGTREDLKEDCGTNTCSGSACQTPSQTCSDGTPYSQCSSTKPLYCSAGTLTNNCQSCDCPSGQSCQSGGACQSQSQYFQPEVSVEAESGTLSGMQTGTSGSDTYVYASGSTGSASYTFQIQSPGKYRMEARVMTPGTDPAAHDSFYMGLDGESAQGNNQYTYDTLITASFAWDNVSLRGPAGNATWSQYDPMLWDLTQGTHTFSFYGREADTRLDQIILKKACAHKSDTDCSGCVSQPELTAFISRWYTSNQDVTITELMQAIGLWKAGGC